jgi:hypothetical protein
MVATLQEEYYAKLDICSLSLNNLHTMQKAIGAAATAPTVTQQEMERNLAAAKLRFEITKQSVEARLAMLQDSSTKQDILTSVVGVKNTLRLLSALESDIENELFKVLDQTVNMPLPKAKNC